MNWKLPADKEKEVNELMLEILGYDSDTKTFIDDGLSSGSTSIPEQDTLPIAKVTAAKDEVTSEVNKYKFPFNQDQLMRMEKHTKRNTSEYYKSTMQELCFDMRDASGNKLPYPEIRERFIECSIMLNILGEIAPRFRPIRTPEQRKKGVPYPENEKLLSNDLQVIDLEWIHRHGLYASDIINFKGLFNSDKAFDIEKATKFTNKVGSKQKKAESIALPPIEQFQLAAIQSKDVIGRWGRIKDKCLKNQIKVKEFFTKPGAKYKEETREFAGDIYKSILIADGSPTAAHKIFSLMTGTTTITKKNFERYIKGLSFAGLL